MQGVKNNKVLILLATMIIVAAMSCCTEKNADSENILIFVSIPPQAEMAKAVGRDLVEVKVMVPPGASPHTYEPTTSQLAALSRADMYAKVGSGIEFELSWINRLTQINQEMLVIDCSENITLIEGDPHVWTSPKNTHTMVENIYAALSDLDPENEGIYRTNKNTYQEKLKEIDQEIANELANKTSKRIMVYHPAWGYFCREYGLEQVAIEKYGKNPTPKTISELIDEAKKNNIQVIFESPQFNTQSAERIAEEIDGRVVLIDPLTESYLANIRLVAEAFSKET